MPSRQIIQNWLLFILEEQHSLEAPKTNVYHTITGAGGGPVSPPAVVAVAAAGRASRSGSQQLGSIHVSPSQDTDVAGSPEVTDKKAKKSQTLARNGSHKVSFYLLESLERN